VDMTAIVAAIVLKNTKKAIKLSVVFIVDAIKKKIKQLIMKIYLMEHKNYE